ncbi:hypothetical protein BCR39DRAFT_540408 [Naematelia encephala]|uniref:Uncharacterized protein n=1 Tax=Naematelia encephala TaxID=71784 RepID=A0A1Y2AVP9_9TREE|nr:hypothetical protein BCR39DRAFT_540408 [Naematelia encephala]
MEDPWAAGPSWSTPAKASSLPGEEAIRSDSPSFSPTPAIDNSDPWGTPAPPTTTSAIPAQVTPDNEKEIPEAGKSSDNAWHADEGHGGWGEEPETQSTESQAVEQPESMSSVPPPRAASPGHEPVWSLDSPSLPTAQLPDTSENAREESAASIPLPTAPDIGTPHRSTSLADLPQLDSPHGSFHSYHSPALSLHEELTGGFGEPSMPKSPSFGDEGFGGFSNGFDNGDPWGGGGGGGGDEWGGGAQQMSGFAEPDEEDSAEEEEDDEGDGWGGSRVRASAPAPHPAQESEWEQAQRMIRVKQERAPDEKVEALRKEWEDIAQTMIGMNKLDKPTEEEERQLEDSVRKLQEATAETLRSLGDIPADLNTYPPVVSSLVTHERHVYALSRPNPTPSTSLLNVSLANQSRRQTTLGIQSTDSSPWLSRSKLGEPDSAPSDTTAQTEEAPKGRWSFWGKRNVSEKQLTTSGGGVLEVKPMTHTGSGSVRSSVEVRPASIAPSIESQPRPPSPPPPVAPTHEDVGHDAPSETPQGPSVVSRFFGRLSRRPSSQKPNDVDAKDIELSADDFSFLDQVPSITSPPPFEHGMGDLLAMEPGRDEQIAGLESMLAAKPAPLPAPLAPPPRGPSAPAYSRSVSQSSTGGRFVPKMAAPAKKASDMDLLSGLDFADDTNTNFASTPPPVTLTSTSQTDMTSSSLSAWDEFLAPSKPTRSITPSASSTPPPAISPSPVIISAPSRSVSTSSPFALPGPPKASSASPGPPKASSASPGPSRIAPPSQSPPPALPPKTPNIGLGDFDDFGTPQKAIHTATFEDFGDFSAFDDPPPPTQTLSSPFVAPQATPLRSSNTTTSTTAQAQQQQQQRQLFTTPTPISKHPVLDHTPTIHLVNGASASKGKRWPAPPSPVAPSLEPPPPPPPPSSRSNSTPGFPFLSPPPPPPSRPTSSLGKPGNNLLGGHADDDPVVTVGLFATPIVAGLAPTPPRASTPSSPLKPSLAPVSASASSAKGGGLSAQDLSFFDSL